MNHRKTVLTNLKKQVIHLKNQLQKIQRPKQNNDISTNHNKSYHGQSSSRFNSNCYDSTYLDKGVKKFQLSQHRYQNLNQVIHQKSCIQKIPKISVYRKNQNQRTKENFKTQTKNQISPRCLSPNPLTGEGYSDKKKGIKTLFPPKSTNKQINKPSNKKHFSFHLYS